MLVRVWMSVWIGVCVLVNACMCGHMSVWVRASVCGCVCVVRVCMCACVDSCVGACECSCVCGSMTVWFRAWEDECEWLRVCGCICVGESVRV